jgi:hypothetical protein
MFLINLINYRNFSANEYYIGEGNDYKIFS